MKLIKFYLVEKSITSMYSILKVQFSLLLNIKFSSLITTLLVWASTLKELGMFLYPMFSIDILIG